jgi:hypothetical protein
LSFLRLPAQSCSIDVQERDAALPGGCSGE